MPDAKMEISRPQAFDIIIIIIINTLTYEIESNDVYDDFHEEKDTFGFSKKPRKFEIYYKANKKVISK